MPINRAPWNALVDDDGSNLVGTVWNKDKIKTVILDPADVAFAPGYASFTPIDASGAGLAFSYAVGNFAQLDRLIFIWLQIVYPATSNGTLAAIGGLPALVAPPGAGGTHCYGPMRVWNIAGDTTVIYALDPATGGRVTNANLSGANIIVSGVYLIKP